MLKILKQELLFIPLMLLLVEGFRQYIQLFYPETALFDRGSELETFIFRVWQITWITSAVWLLTRVVFPPAFYALRRFYNGFEDFKEEYKQNMALKIFLVFFLSLVYLCGKGASASPNPYKGGEQYLRAKLVDTLTKQLHVRELTGRNDGVEVERYLKFVGFNKGAAWCAAYVSYNLFAVGIMKPVNPMSAWAPVFANERYVILKSIVDSHKSMVKIQPGDIFTVWSEQKKMVCHVGFIIHEKETYFITNEGNTGSSGTSEGSGVHSLKRSKLKVYRVTNYITPFINQKTKHETT